MTARDTDAREDPRAPSSERWLIRRLALLVPLLAAGFAALPGCKKQREQPRTESESSAAVTPGPEHEPPTYVFEPIDPSTVTPLEVLYFPDYVGEGYERTPIEIGPTLYSGKWLGLAGGDARFLGRGNRIVVNHFRGPSPNPFLGEVEKSVLLDVDSGEVVAEFEREHYTQHHRGLAIVFKADDERPHLLDAESGELVLALPEGEHDYEYERNYWLRFSAIAKRVWIYARDDEGVVHLYEWEDRSRPPELPNNPFPFFPDRWDPRAGSGDTEEVMAEDILLDCTRAVLIPPKRYECLDELELEDTVPLSAGWRIDYGENGVFNRRDGRAIDFSPLCPEGSRPQLRALERAPVRVQVGCEGEPGVWVVWTPAGQLQRMDPEHATRVNNAKLTLHYHSDLDRYELKEHFPREIETDFDQNKLTHELVGDDYGSCPDIYYRSGGPTLYGMACKQGGRMIWFDLIDTRHDVRSRFREKELAINREDLAIGIVRRNGRDRVVRLTVSQP